MKRLLVIIIISVFAGTVLFSDESFSFTGYSEINGLMAMPDFQSNVDDWRFGSALSSSFRMEIRSVSGITAVLQAHAEFSGGYLNPLGRFRTTGLPDDPGLVSAEALPGADFNSSFVIDQAWVAWTHKDLNVSFGFIPISWGAAWLLHPVDKVNQRNLGSLFSDEVKGVPAITADLALGWSFGLAGYLGLSDKSANGLAELDEVRPENLPFAVKFMAYPAAWEISLGFAREIINKYGYERNNWIISDLTGNILDVGLTAETAVRLPDKGEDWSFFDALELSLGLTYLIEAIDLELMVEYSHLGQGSSDSSLYDITSFLDGSALFLAEDYLMTRLAWKGSEVVSVDLGCMLNLNDRSFLILPAMEWNPISDLEFSFGMYFPIGSASSEFAGERLLAPGVSWKPWDDATAVCSMKVYY